MTTSRDDFTLDELLDDLLTRAVMKADRVDRSTMEALWRGLAPKVASERRSLPKSTFAVARDPNREALAKLCEPWAARGETSACFTARRVVSQLCGAR